MACILLWSSAVRVHDSQADRKMDVTRERISRIAHSLTFGALKSESFKPPADTEQPAGATSSVECQPRGVVAEAERCLWGWDALSLWKQVLARSVIGLDTLHPSPVIYLSGMPSACEGFKKKKFFFFLWSLLLYRLLLKEVNRYCTTGIVMRIAPGRAESVSRQTVKKQNKNKQNKTHTHTHTNNQQQLSVRVLF